MAQTPVSPNNPHHLMAMLCFGIFAGAMALNAIPSTEDHETSSGGMIWNTFQFGLPLLIGGMCLTGQRWAFMTAIIYGTVGLALDLATLVQSLTAESASPTFMVIIMTTGVLNFLVIVLGGKILLSATGLKTHSKNS